MKKTRKEEFHNAEYTPKASSEYLHYEWSKGYLPTENPKPDVPDLPLEPMK